MKKNIIIFCLFLVSFSGYAQQAYNLGGYNQNINRRRVCLNNEINTPEYQAKVLENTRVKSPDIYAKMVSASLNKTGVDVFQIGDKKDFFVINTLTSQLEIVKATLKASGNLANVWVDTTEMTNSHVTSTEIDAVLKALETSTPEASRDPNKGIVAIDNEYFGNAPNYDGDGKVDFLLCNIKDDFETSGSYVSGLFYSLDQSEQYGSNKRDILYVDTYPSIYYNGERNLSTVLQTTAHEYQHLIHYNYDKSEITFVNEALSQNAEVICGYDVFDIVKESDYFSNTNRSLFTWVGYLRDYSRATLWLLYLTEQLGDSFMKKLVQNSQTGLSGINSALTQVSSPYTFQQHLVNWNTANYLKDKSYNSLYGYDYPVKSQPSAKIFSNPNVTNSYIGTIAVYGSTYIKFNSQSKNFKFKFTSGLGSLNIKMIATGPNSKKVLDISYGVEYEEPEFKNTYDNIIFVLTNTSGSSDASCTLTSSGTIVLENDEITYDSGEPQTIGDTGMGYLYTTTYPYGGWAVRFYPKDSQNRLKKIKLWVGFDQEFSDGTAPASAPKRFQVHIWKAINDSTPGADIITPFMFQSYRSEIADEFVEIDLNAYKDQLTNLSGPIFVGFLEDDEYVTSVGVSNASPADDATFIRGLGSDTLWYPMRRLTISGTSLNGWNAMVRALFVYYVSTGVEETVEEIPSSFKLSQNYPNPFNPETKIEYSISGPVNVNIVIYDVLGRAVKTLVKEFKNSGNYSIVWNGDDNLGRKVASGLYFYRMEAGAFSSVKKLNLIK